MNSNARTLPSGGGKPLRCAINGVGRIGKLVYRQWLRERLSGRTHLDIVAINDTGAANADAMAYALKYDSVHGRSAISVRAEGDKIISESGSSSIVLSEATPENLPWKELGIDLVFEATGLFREPGEPHRHLEAGAGHVILSAPSNAADATILLGVNQDSLDLHRHKVISFGSCGLNCIATGLATLMDIAEVRDVYVLMNHSVIPQQPILDAWGRGGLTRGRSAMTALIPVNSDLNRHVKAIWPAMTGNVTVDLRFIPIPAVSLSDIVVDVDRDITPAELNDAFRAAAQGSRRGILGVADDPYVSTDCIGLPYSAIYDEAISGCLTPRKIKLGLWFDNELATAARIYDLATLIATKS